MLGGHIQLHHMLPVIINIFTFTIQIEFVCASIFAIIIVIITQLFFIIIFFYVVGHLELQQQQKKIQADLALGLSDRAKILDTVMRMPCFKHIVKLSRWKWRKTGKKQGSWR